MNYTFSSCLPIIRWFKTRIPILNIELYYYKFSSLANYSMKRKKKVDIDIVYCNTHNCKFNTFVQIKCLLFVQIQISILGRWLLHTQFDLHYSQFTRDLDGILCLNYIFLFKFRREREREVRTVNKYNGVRFLLHETPFQLVTATNPPFIQIEIG